MAELRKKINPVLCFIVGAVLYGLVRAYLAQTLVLDDTEYLAFFQSNLAERGNLLEALMAVLFNADILAYSGDFRTYGISRLLHVIIMLIFGNNCKVYAFIIGFSHMMTGYFVYKIVKFLQGTRECALLCTLVYVFSPFIRVQSFHHFTYLMLPFYFLLMYIWWELKVRSKGMSAELGLKQNVASMLWVVLIVFTGEHTLPMLFCVLFFLAIAEGRKGSKKGIIKYIALMVWEVFLFVGWYLVWNNFIDKSETSRFSSNAILVKEGISDYILSASRAARSFLNIFMEYSPTVRSSLSQYTLEHFSVIVAVGIVITSIVISFGLYGIMRKDESDEIRKPRGMALLLLFLCSSGAVYLALEIFTQSYSLPGRYFYVTLTLILVFIAMLVFYVFNARDAKIAAILLVCLCVGENIVWHACLLTETKESDQEISAFLDEAEYRGIKNVVIYNSGYPWTNALNDISTYRGESAFDWSVVMAGWLQEKYNFDNVLFTKDGTCEETGKTTIQVYDEKTQREVSINKSDVCFAGISNISNEYGRYGKAKLNYYFGFEEYRKCADRYGLEYYSSSPVGNRNYSLTQKENLLYVDVGNETSPESGLMPDKPYESVGKDQISYGYCGDGLVANMIPEDLFNSVGQIGQRFMTNRYSNTGSMEYKFSNLPREESLAVVIDGYEWWQYSDEKRIYDIEVKTDYENYWLSDVDTYSLGYVEDSQTHKSVYRIMINLPNTSEASVILHSRQGSDVATMNGIGIVKR